MTTDKDAGGYDQRKVPGSFSANINRIRERHIDILDFGAL